MTELQHRTPKASTTKGARSLNRLVSLSNQSKRLVFANRHSVLDTESGFRLVGRNDVVLMKPLLCVIVFAFLLLCALATPSFAADKLDKLDSARMTTLNMTDEQIAEVYGIDSTKLATGPTLQELNEENPSYVKREYDHKQQVVVGSVVMFCVALAMILMNNYNPKR